MPHLVDGPRLSSRAQESSTRPNRASIEAAVAAETVEWARRTLELSTSEIALILRVSDRTVKRWLQREAPPAPENRAELRKLNQFRYLLESIFASPSAALNWALSPNDALRGYSPVDAMTDGNMELVVSLLAGLEAGAHL